MPRDHGVLLAASLALSACSGRATHPPEPLTADVAPPVGQGEVSVVGSRADVALVGPRVEAEPGDFMIRHDGMVAVVSRRRGHVIDFGPEGARDELVLIAPAVFDAMSLVRAPVVAAAPVGPGGSVLRVEHRASTLPVRHVSFFTFWGRVLVMESVALPEDAYASGMAVGLGERVSWGNVPTWIEGEGFPTHRGGTFGTRFIARDGPGLVYALGLDGVRLVARFGTANIPGFHAQGRSAEVVVAGPPEGAMRRRVLMSASTRSIGDAAAQLSSNGAEAVAPMPGGLPKDARVEVAACPEFDGRRRPYARFGAADDRIAVPKGCFEARLIAPGHAASSWTSLGSVATAALPPSGTIVVRATEAGRPVPARVQLRGVGSTSDPSWGEDPETGAALSAVHTETGALERPAPPGTYEVVVDRGFEYGVHQERVTIEAGQKVTVAAPIERVVDTSGFLSADLHLHAMPSPDAPQSLEDRVRALAAAGVEVGVATDHNRVTDYREAIASLALGSHVASVIGDEVTTEEMAFGHFNVFPLEAQAAPLRWEATNPTDVFREARRQPPRFGDTILQVNHPRMGDIGYFDVIRLDRDDIAGFSKRRSGWLAFDAIEVFNGDDVVDIAAVEECMKDWFAMMDAGLHVTATGNSDSHKLTFHEPGLPRTWVAMPSDDVARFDQDAFVDAVRAGKAIVSSGPFVRLDVGGRGPGETAPAGLTPVTVTVDAPPWVDVSAILVIQRGRLVATATGPFEVGPHAAELQTTLTLAKGDWVVAIAHGSKPMAPLFRRGVVPYAFTNAVWVGP